jgi:hypothetical protein
MLAGIKAKTAGVVVLAVGIIVLILSLARDLIRVRGAAFGPLQIAGTIVGAIVVIVGLVLILRK